jgi:hypothetical protein
MTQTPKGDSRQSVLTGPFASVEAEHPFREVLELACPQEARSLEPPDWTLALEAQFYLASPVVWLLFARLGAGVGSASSWR